MAGSASGAPGDTVTFFVTLATGSLVTVNGTQNDITFDSVNTPIVAVGGEPDCIVNPGINKSVFLAFLPHGCSGTACNQVRVMVGSFSDLSAIPDGSIVYACTVKISSTAAPGSYPMVMSNAEGSDLNLGNIYMYGWNGSITVHGPTPSPTP